jgi:aspartyl-tRNA synthetase
LKNIENEKTAMLDDLGDLERTNSCGTLRSEDVGKNVVLMGWVARRRDFGPLTFVDLRDRDGITQVVFNEETAPEAHARAKELRGEYVIAVTGEVVLREESQRNPKLATGEIEVQARELRVLNDARTLPFQLETVAPSDTLASEDLRLKYRYLDLRRPQLQANMRLRHSVLQQIRSYMSAQSYTEIETPILIKSTPEGARDYIVPSRIQPGKFFALPQSPQLFKQLCMIAGLDKYFQIARCFRDEDLRADRQPEFTQLDVELSFANPEQIYRLIEGLFVEVFRLIGVELSAPFLRMPYAEAMSRFGSDKPDLRFGMELQNLAPAVQDTTFAPFASTLASGGRIKGITVAGGVNLSRKVLDELQEFVKRYGAGALAWIKVGDEISSSLLKALGEETVKRMADLAGAANGDAVLIVAGRAKVVAASLGALRNEVARREKLIPENTYVPLWVTEFPMFEYDEVDDRYYAMHHPFTSPLDEDLSAFQRAVEGGETKLLGTLRAKAYDAVINGVEVAGGSIRIHRNDVQQLVFKALGISHETARARFGFFLDALEFGTPPHGGIASGIERLMMVLAGTENIRDVMAFPKTASAADLMIDAPGEVDPAQLRELRIEVESDQ